MGRRLAGLVLVAMATAGCSSGTDTTTPTTAVEDGLPFAETTAEPTFTIPPTTAAPTTIAPPVTQAFVSPAPAAAAPAPRANCHSSYPDTCIPPPPPDLDCGDVAARRFTVRQPDPHGFDADRDGVGCESG